MNCENPLLEGRFLLFGSGCCEACGELEDALIKLRKAAINYAKQTFFPEDFIPAYPISFVSELSKAAEEWAAVVNKYKK